MPLAIAPESAPIETDPQGVVRVAKTRVTLDTVVTAFLEGCTPEEIGEQYPSLQLSGSALMHGTKVIRLFPLACTKMHYPL
ncbi:DUF433 domain-containing protein [Phormidium sp. FACHB-1136]|uniref:DUF433 domain-containing protein n=1 Tax=Phormidium sp. FACHB-1136 TaxID=2692848 RepID=UPI0018F00089|nr:DUF433 domain-containing protein [Phormidium sp. FACHB-1136]